MIAPRELGAEERASLLRAARRAIAEHLAGRALPVVDDAGEALQEPRGAFVSLHKAGRLRGCIGTFEASAPLIRTVQRMAVSAATSDPRFPPVTEQELPQLALEISVLSPLREVRPQEVTVGQHGVYITRGTRRGVLLPQVATEHGWDRQTFLQHTCLKAGLPPEAWQDPRTMIEAFTAEVFGEE